MNTTLLTKALVRMVDEHGAPNTFAPSEVTLVGGPSPMLQGKLAQSPLTRELLSQAVNAQVSYEDRRWVVKTLTP